ncbi:hypothetical protein BT67DRAFT_394713 [Trichocladium antarcticum]|uniref:Uncharacterized protein n=1 Tax=Trichocladium antarcticum TaxID=1450529 RepID=A0AAN6UUH5_9PEZI|nr:hypothetical protein BT67DRAFT_394713 [Trichocladium antarcticum]
MSSRLTAPVSKLTRSFSTTPSIARPSHLLNNASKAASGAGRKTKVASEEDATAGTARHHSTTTTTTPHRPSLAPRKPVPFMQTFHHSAPKPAALSTNTIDRAVLPNLHMSAESLYDPYAHIRVPLLPDNTSPPAGFRQAEAPDLPLPQAEIRVVAANPEQVLPAALTEVEGMGVDGVELGFARLLGQGGEGERYDEMGSGMIRDLWKGMVEDVFGGPPQQQQAGKGPAAA